MFSPQYPLISVILWRTNIMKLKHIANSIAAMAMVCGTGSTLAGPILDNSVSTCTGVNCSSLRIPGTIFSTSSSALPWVGQFYGTAGQCMRFDVTSQGADLEMVVIAPNGTMYRDDDGGAGLLPLVKIGSAPNTGWYTVQLSHFSGAAVEVNFIMYYGRYNGGNANCAAPTAGTSTAGAASAAQKQDGPVQPPNFNETE